MSKINLKPTVCNICSGDVIYTYNSRIYGKTYGNGRCYLCTQCGAYVGVHTPRPREALGVLADERMRKGKICCHNLFDAHWKDKKNSNRKRRMLYKWLANELQIPVEDCHFGYFDLDTLQRAYKILKQTEGKSPVYNSKQELIGFL